MSDKIVTIDDILHSVSEKSRISEEAMKSRDRHHHILVPRQIVMFLAKELTEMSYKSIGKFFGRNHATALHARKKIIERLSEGDEKVIAIVSDVKSLLNGVVPSDIIGLTVLEADEILARDNKHLKVIQRDGVGLPSPNGDNPARFNVAVTDGIITKVFGTW